MPAQQPQQRYQVRRAIALGLLVVPAQRVQDRLQLFLHRSSPLVDAL